MGRVVIEMERESREKEKMCLRKRRKRENKGVSAYPSKEPLPF